MILGNLIRHYRTTTSRSLDAVAKEIGVSNATLSRIENDQREIDSKTLVKVLVWIFGGNDPAKG